ATLDGTTVAVCFNELLDNNPDTKTAEDNFNYTIDGVSGPLVNTATLRADGKSVLLSLAGPVGSTYTLTIINVRDRWSNGIVSVDIVGTNHALTTAAVGSLNPVGTNFSCNANTFEVTGGGLDLQNAADQFEFLYRSVDGDFDARVRVVSLVSSNAAQSLEATAKAILTARATADTGSPAVNIYSTAPYPADNAVLMTYRSTVGGGTTTNTPAFTQGGLPYWLRIKRAGNTFTTYRSPDGTTWTEMGNTTATSFGSSALVGLGALSRRNGRFGTATFSDFRILQAPNAPQLINSSYSSGNFSASFQTQSGFSYEVQFTTTLTPPSWNTLTTIPGDGTVKPFTDSAGGQSRFYRVIAR
ncbi:MAG TPA: hypothetical protein VK615_03475, partial [Candidatus Binatia bacterium]|nr:hypothetical protein [Candidatus Binatia bacterium]